MKATIQQRNNIVRAIIAVVLLADAVLIGIQWKINSSPHVQATDLNRLAMVEKQYRG